MATSTSRNHLLCQEHEADTSEGDQITGSMHGYGVLTCASSRMLYLPGGYLQLSLSQLACMFQA